MSAERPCRDGADDLDVDAAWDQLSAVVQRLVARELQRRGVAAETPATAPLSTGGARRHPTSKKETAPAPPAAVRSSSTT